VSVTHAGRRRAAEINFASSPPKSASATPSETLLKADGIRRRAAAADFSGEIGRHAERVAGKAIARWQKTRNSGRGLGGDGGQGFRSGATSRSGHPHTHRSGFYCSYV
jgi:hypothetical protein